MGTLYGALEGNILGVKNFRNFGYPGMLFKGWSGELQFTGDFRLNPKSSVLDCVQGGNSSKTSLAAYRGLIVRRNLKSILRLVESRTGTG